MKQYQSRQTLLLARALLGGLVALVFVAAPLWQLAGIGLTVILAVTTGVAVGFVVSRLGTKETSYDDKEEFTLPD